MPVLILFACALVLLQPRLTGWLQQRSGYGSKDGGVPVWGGVLGTAVYGGYFGAAQGVLLMALFGTLLPDDLRRLNAATTVLAALANGVAAAVALAI